MAGNEGWLTGRIIQYAKERGYAPLTSTLEQAWLASICGLSAPLVMSLEQGDALFEVQNEADLSRDPIANYGVEVARRHRSRGISLGLFLGLMKNYRRTYQDLVSISDVSQKERRRFRTAIDTFFDRIEIGISNEWADTPASEQIAQLSLQNQSMTNEKNKYLTIFESLSDPVILVGGAGEIENMNFAAADMFMGQTAPGATYYGSAKITLSQLLGVDVIAGDPVPVERELNTRRGPRWFSIKTQHMLDVSEKHLGTVVILTDVTEYRRAREQAEAANRAKSAFLATMSHEIRTPLHGILGISELLEQTSVTAQEREYAGTIARSAEVLSSIVIDILDYSKIESGNLDVEKFAFSVAGVVEEVFGLVQPLVMRRPDVQVILQLPELPVVVGDRGKLRQILLNLIGNAVKFTDHGMVLVTVAAEVGPGEAWGVRFDVADTGIGIDAARIEAIFEPFTQADPSVVRRFGGSGLGLAICRRLINHLGGKIMVESTPGSGSRFSFTLPFDRSTEALVPDAGNTAEKSPNSTHRAFPARALDVLVVEDNEVNALVTMRSLERLGHHPTLASCGAQALAMASEARFDVIFLDLRLPDMDGIMIAHKIRALAEPVRAGVPIVAMSAHVHRDDIQQCLDAGMNDFLGKPFRFNQLKAMLERIVGMSVPRSIPSPASAVSAGWAGGLDERVLSRHVAELGMEDAAKIVAIYIDNVARTPENLERLAERGAWPQIAEIAHQLKSSSLHVGLLHVSSSAAEAERAARAGAAGADALVAKLVLELRKSLVLLGATWDMIVETHATAKNLADSDQPANR